jgi:hypothetical protein
MTADWKTITKPTQWTTEMDDRLRALWGHWSIIAIGEAMGLSAHRVRTRARNLGLQHPGMRRILQPPARVWVDLVQKHAASLELAPRDVLEGNKCRAASLARWRAMQDILDMYPECSIAGLARITGFDRTGIMHGLRRLSGHDLSEVRRCRAVGRVPKMRAPVLPEVAPP